MLHAAVSAGADAVYLGMGAFNARRNADNFDFDTFAEACDYAHMRGVRVYVAMNTVILPHELDDAVSTAKKCHALGADAFIVQDVGLAVSLAYAIPGVRLHASTQMSILSADGVLAAAQLGMRRVTLARELSIEEIACLCAVANEVGVELEVFAHGALCVCYSGQCLMSSMIGGRSANRGLCAQACRLPYELKDMRDPDRNLKSPGPHLLSPKDLCAIDSIERLVQVGVSSFKIEGRMKSPEYVYTVAQVYRDALEGIKGNGVFGAYDGVSPSQRLESVFSRGFTQAYLVGDRGNDIMSYQRPNNRGQFIGRVKRCGDDVLQISTEVPLVEGDVIEIWTSRTNIPIIVRPGFRQRNKTVDIPIAEDLGPDTKMCSAPKGYRYIHPNDRVFRVRSADAAYRDDDREPRIPIAGKVVLRMGQPLWMEFWLYDDGSPLVRRLLDVLADKVSFLGGHGGKSDASDRDGTVSTNESRGIAGDVPLSACAEGVLVEGARTKPVTIQEVEEHVDRLGQTPFKLMGLEVVMDEGVGIGFSQIHRVRSEALEALERALLSAYAQFNDIDGACGSRPNRESVNGNVAQVRPSKDDIRVHANGRPPRIDVDVLPSHAICVLATNPECARAAKRAGADAIYVPALNYKRGQASYEGCLAESPSQAGFPKHCTITIPSIVHDECKGSREGITSTDVWEYVQAGNSVMVESLGALFHAVDLGVPIEIGASLPITNQSAAELMQAFGARLVWLSPELNLGQISKLASTCPTARFGIKVSGAQELMTTEHCMLMSQGACTQQCAVCTRRRVPHALRDRKGYDFPVITDSLGRSHIYNSVQLDTVHDLADLLRAGVSDFMIDATLMRPEQVAQATGRLCQALEKALSSGEAVPKQPNTTSGHLHRGVL